LTDLFYYLDRKHGFFEGSLPLPFLKKILRERISFLVERFAERFLGELYGLQPAKALRPELEVWDAEGLRKAL